MQRSVVRLAWGLWSLAVGLAAAHVALQVLGRHIRASPGFGFPGFLAALAVVFATVGVVVASRRSSNPIGWIFIGVGVLAGVQGAGFSYALNGVLGPSAPWPGAEIGAWLNAWLWYPAIMAATTFVFMIFPDGRFVSARWRVAAWSCGSVVSVATALLAVAPGPLENFGTTSNPVAVPYAFVRPLSQTVFNVSNLVVVVGVAALVARYRRSDATGREQIKWIGYAGAMAAIVIPAGDVFVGVGPNAATVGPAKIADILIISAVLFIPISIGIAVLRYRLFDIDRIISRTVAYTVITAILVGVYAIVALIPTAVMGSDDAPDGLVAAATLLAAAAFVPVRRRVQNALDKRFNRAHYDATRTIESFSSRLRDETDVDTLVEELRGVVARTMQPALVSVWVRDR